MSVLSLWWAWLVAAVLFGALEVMLPVFAFLGFAAGAAVTGVLLLVGLDLGTGPTLLIFAALSAGAYLAIRRILGTQAGRARIVTRDINEN
jgi:inner membrane protein